jgi:hypothetical protein
MTSQFVICVLFAALAFLILLYFSLFVRPGGGKKHGRFYPGKPPQHAKHLEGE